MFDIGPLELLIIFVVALVVIGPEKLPATVKTVSLWIGRFRRSFHKIKAEVEKELNADEIRRQLHNESIMAEVENAKAKVDEVTKDVKSIADDANPKDDIDLGLDTKSKDESAQAASAAESAAVNPTTDSEKPEEKDNSIAGEFKQAVSYVNDISRDVKQNVKEIEEDFEKPTPEKPSPEKKAKSGKS